jgi:hypothetical protein
MKVTLNWLKQYVDINWSPEELTGRLTMPGLEIESRFAASEWRQIVAHSASCGLAMLFGKSSVRATENSRTSAQFLSPLRGFESFYICSHGFHRGLLSVAAPQLKHLILF